MRVNTVLLHMIHIVFLLESKILKHALIRRTTLIFDDALHRDTKKCLQYTFSLHML